MTTPLSPVAAAHADLPDALKNDLSLLMRVNEHNPPARNTDLSHMMLRGEINLCHVMRVTLHLIEADLPGERSHHDELIAAILDKYVGSYDHVNLKRLHTTIPEMLRCFRRAPQHIGLPKFTARFKLGKHVFRANTPKRIARSLYYLDKPLPKLIVGIVDWMHKDLSCNRKQRAQQRLTLWPDVLRWDSYEDKAEAERFLRVLYEAVAHILPIRTAEYEELRDRRRGVEKYSAARPHMKKRYGKDHGPGGQYSRIRPDVGTEAKKEFPAITIENAALALAYPDGYDLVTFLRHWVELVELSAKQSVATWQIEEMAQETELTQQQAGHIRYMAEGLLYIRDLSQSAREDTEAEREQKLKRKKQREDYARKQAEAKGEAPPVFKNDEEEDNSRRTKGNTHMTFITETHYDEKGTPQYTNEMLSTQDFVLALDGQLGGDAGKTLREGDILKVLARATEIAKEKYSSVDRPMMSVVPRLISPLESRAVNKFARAVEYLRVTKPAAILADKPEHME